MNVLDLFSGIGGFSLGLERAGMRTVAFCEIEPFCRKVLAKHWPNVKQYTDVRTLTAEQLRADGITVDVICGGFPCQPFSISGEGHGARLGKSDDRYLWPEYLRIIEELRPTWVIGENVIGIVDMALDNVLADLEGIGYSARAFDIPACAVGAEHKRRRVWIVANDIAQRGQGNWQEAVSQFTGLQGREDGGGSAGIVRRPDISRPWLCRAGNGVSARLDAIGNAVVPQIPELIGRAILNAERKAT